MLQSYLFTKTKREAPKDEEAINAQLLIRGGFVDKLAAGIYNFLPLGLRVLRKIENIIREEMMAIGGQEILMAALHPKEIWEITGRWKNFDALFKFKGIGDKEYALGATHEEIVSPLTEKFVFSYKDLPLYLFQIQTKFRNETRAKSGILRTKEFSMKDFYSFHADLEDLDEYHSKMIKVYFKIFERCGLRDVTYLTVASGGAFSEYSHEFQVVAPQGEDTIYVCQKCKLAINEEIKKENSTCSDCGFSEFKKMNAIEIGNIFKLGTRFSEPFKLKFKDQNGKEKLVVMGCYGIGPSRVMGTVVEIFNDEKGIIWPEEIAPFKVHLLYLGETKDKADKLYENLQKLKIEVLYDDRENSAGEKFADADLIGIPWRVVVSEKTGKKFEIKNRKEKEVKLVDEKELMKILSE